MLTHKPRQTGEAPDALAAEADVRHASDCVVNALRRLFESICESSTIESHRFTALGGAVQTLEPGEEQKQESYKILWAIGLFLMWLNCFLGVVSLVPAEPDESGVFRYFEAIYRLVVMDPGAWGVHSGPVLIAFVILVVALLFKKLRNARALSKVLVVSMSLHLVFTLVKLIGSSKGAV